MWEVLNDKLAVCKLIYILIGEFSEWDCTGIVRKEGDGETTAGRKSADDALSDTHHS